MRRLLLAAAVASAAIAPLPAQAPQRRVAVLPFDFSAVRQNAAQLFGPDVDLGEAVADLIAGDLVKTGTYIVLDRSQLETALRDNGYQQASRTDAATAAKIAKILNVNAIIIGRVSGLTHSENQMGVASGMKIAGISVNSVGTKTSTATAAIDARVVDANSGDILAAANASGSGTGTGLSATGVSNGGQSQLDLGGADYASSAVGKALNSAAQKIAADLSATAAKLAATKVAIRGLVADVGDDGVIINVGTDAGVVVGAEYDVVRPGRVVKDPASGRVLRVVTTPVGKLRITQADSGSATGKMSGGTPQVGDCVGACPAPAGS